MDFPSALAILASPGGHAVPRAEAESIVQAVVNDPSRGIQALCHALDSRDDGTHRLAAVLLSTAAARHWSVLGDDAKAAMRQRTLAALSRAEDRAEMRALVHAADILASRSADDGSPWHELLPALDDAAKSARATPVVSLAAHAASTPGTSGTPSALPWSNHTSYDTQTRAAACARGRGVHSHRPRAALPARSSCTARISKP